MEMSRVPLFGLIYKTGSILVNRTSDGSRRDSFAKMQETLDQGTNLCLYPEGTRNKTSQPMQSFFDGAFVIAIKSQKPVVPGLIFNTGEILPGKEKFWMRPLPVRIHFLEPIPTKGMTLDDLPVFKARVRSLMEEYYTTNN